MTGIQIQSDAGDVMTHDALQAYPHECCGFMFGREDVSGGRLIVTAMPVFNSSAENKQRRFVIAPMDYMKAEQFAAEHELDLLGAYHSHPDHPAEPSEHDRVAAQPWFSYLIISVVRGEVKDVRSWRLNDSSQFDEESVIETALSNQIK